MKILVLDDENKKNGKIEEMLNKKKLDGIHCCSSNEFMEAAEAAKFDTLFINADTWCKGRAIYDYFGISKKIEHKPVVFYNAEEKFCGMGGRKSVENDKIYYKPLDLEKVFPD